MAFFKEPNDYHRIDWELIQNGSITLYWQTQYLEETIMWLRQNKYKITEFACSTWHDEKAMYENIAKSLEFPGYFGRNLDALNDCLSEIDVPIESGHALVMRDFDVFSKSFCQIAWNLLDILESNSRHNLLLGRILITLLQSTDPQITFEPVGACPVNWNRKEWCNKSRG